MILKLFIQVIFNTTRCTGFLLLSTLFLSCASDPPVSNEREKIAKQRYLEDYRAPSFSWGFLNMDGRIIIEPQYDEVGSFRQGFAVVNKNGLWGCIDSNGTVNIPLRYQGLWAISDGLFRANNFQGMTGYIAPSGDTIIPFNFNDGRDFIRGLAPAAINGKWGVINKNGSMEIQALYQKIERADEFFKVQTEDGTGLINESGQVIIPPGYSSLSYKQESSLISACKGNDCGYINRRNEVIIPFDYQSVTTFDQGRAVVSDRSEYFLIDTSGNTISSRRWNYLSYIEEGRWLARLNDGFVLLDHQGNRIGNQNYEAIYPFSDGRAAFQSEQGLWGYMNRSGDIVIEPEFGLAWSFEDGKARVAFRNGVGLIDRSGAVILAPYYEEIRQPSGGMIPFKRSKEAQ